VFATPPGEQLKTPASAGSRRQSFAFPIPSGIFFGHKSYLKGLYSEYKEKLISRVKSTLHRGKCFPLGLLITISFLSLTVLHVSRVSLPIAMSNSLLAEESCNHQGCNITLPQADIALVDFPALISVETSLEKTLESIVGSSALARLLKQGEMAISDLGTVVRHSELGCKETLSGLLDNLARLSGEIGMSLQTFESKVWGVLDQLSQPSYSFFEVCATDMAMTGLIRQITGF
jgi:hypothetical protein